MKRIFLYLIIAFVAAACTKQAEQPAPVVVQLWPDGAPSCNGYTEEHYDSIHSSMVICPTLTVYVPEKPCGQAVLCCPGGGYVDVWHGTEGYNYGPWFTSRGITLAVLKYRTPNGHSGIPLEDVRRAMELMREHAEEWHIGQLGIMGFSAGGHLASTAATHWETEAQRPDFQILFYPVITMDTAYTHMGSRHFLLGDEPTDEEVHLYSNELQVTAATPEAFIVYSADDGLVPPRNAETYCTALREHGVSCTMLSLPSGGHGWSGHPEFPYNALWQSALSEWLQVIRR